MLHEGPPSRPLVLSASRSRASTLLGPEHGRGVAALSVSSRLGGTGYDPVVWGYSRTMATVVIVASAEVERELLADHVDVADELHVVVPAVEQSRLQWLTNDESDARAHAKDVGDEIVAEAPVAEGSVDVKQDPPSQAVLDAIAEHDPDRILVVLRAGDDATWLEEGELAEVPGELAGVPVTRLTI